MPKYVERFLCGFDKRKDGCWIWKRGRYNDGYGQLHARRIGQKRLGFRAHRFSWELYRGSIPSGMCILHKCDTPLCVNPDHLFIGTPQDNTDDMVLKGRGARGFRSGRYTKPESTPKGGKHYASILTERDVRQIFSGVKSGTPQIVFARKFGVLKTTISAIIHGRNWNHVTGLEKNRKLRVIQH